jgi:4'-phosphopantetheinyl transferase
MNAIMPQQSIEENCLTRWYIDTRQLSSTFSSLPLLETLQPSDQVTVKKFYHLADRHMSLASYLLKYYFIHSACRIPWNEITISRTPEPHRRPCFLPASQTRPDGTPIPNVEFNVSHQASLVTLAGCIIPSSCPGLGHADSRGKNTLITGYTSPQPSSSPDPLAAPQVGIDISCADEPSRRSRNPFPTTPQALASFVDVFSEVFSHRELNVMKTIPHWSPDSTTGPTSLEGAIKSQVRLFYAYWALKEAYIKMTGEALLAPWLRELEFTNVTTPEISLPGSNLPGLNGNNQSGQAISITTPSWSESYTGVQTWLYGKKMEDLRIEIVAFETDYFVATAARGAGLGAGSQVAGATDPWRELEKIDILKDIAPCAQGQCQCCLSQQI